MVSVWSFVLPASLASEVQEIQTGVSWLSIARRGSRTAMRLAVDGGHWEFVQRLLEVGYAVLAT